MSKFHIMSPFHLLLCNLLLIYASFAGKNFTLHLMLFVQLTSLFLFLFFFLHFFFLFAWRSNQIALNQRSLRLDARARARARVRVCVCEIDFICIIASVCTITKTYLYNFDPLKPHFYIVKLGFTGVYIIFLISAQKHRLWVLVRAASARRF